MSVAPDNRVEAVCNVGQWSSMGRPEALFVIGGTAAQQDKWIQRHREDYPQRDYALTLNTNDFMSDDGKLKADHLLSEAHGALGQKKHVIIKGPQLVEPDIQKALIKPLGDKIYKRAVALDGTIKLDITQMGCDSIVAAWTGSRAAEITSVAARG